MKQNEFRYKNFNMLSEVFTKDNYFTTFDLKSWYHHIKINKEHRKIYCFWMAFWRWFRLIFLILYANIWSIMRILHIHKVF